MIKSRTLHTEPVYIGTRFNSNGTSSEFRNQHDYGFEEIITENNPGYRKLVGDIGGPFSLRRIKESRGTAPCEWESSNGSSRYEGYVTVTIPRDQMPSVVPTAAAYGAELYQRMRPAQPLMQGLNALYELRELPKMLKQRFTRDLNGASNYWLALQFGWKPLLSDVRNMIAVQRNGEKYIKQLIRDAGKPVRRRSEITISSSTTRSKSTGITIFNPVGYVGLNTIRETSVEIEDKVWGVARFRYHLPEGPRDILWTANMLGRIYGLYPTPGVVYNAVPWTWLVDWFTGIGTMVNNIGPGGVADRLAADYFYVMRQTKRVTTVQATGSYQKRSAYIPTSGSSTSEVVTKSRLKGSPFGWGISQENLTPMQLSILGALGKTRL